MPAIQFSGAIFRRFNPVFLTVPNHQFIIDFNQIITSIILILLTFLQIKFHSITDQKDSPFTTHPIVMNVAVYGSGVHFFTYGVVLRFPLHRLAFLAHHLLVSSGYVAVAALTVVVLPDAAAPFVYTIFGLLSATELLLWTYCKLVHEAQVWYHQIWQICRFFSNFFGNLENSPPRLPV